MKSVTAHKFILSGALFSIILFTLPLFSIENRLEELLTLARTGGRVEKKVKTIYIKDNLLYCQGKDQLAVVNNKGAELIRKGKYSDAIKEFKSGLKKEALFFPFRYNLGLAYLFLNEYKRSLLEFQRAQNIVPEYARTYIQIGTVYGKLNNEREAIYYFREALKRNNRELNTFILIGNIFFSRNQIQMSKKYYQAALKIDPRFPNGIIGLAKIHFREGDYLKCINRLKSISTTGEYDKSFHFYYAEASFKMQDYQTAVYHYEKLLQFRQDPFFITNAASLIEHKRALSKRFVER